MPENTEINEVNEEQTNSSVKDNTPKKKKGSIINDLFEIIESTLITIFVMVLIFTYLLHPVNVVGSSMNNTLVDGDDVFMCTICPSIDYGDVVIIDNNEAFLLSDDGQVIKKDISNSRLNECIIKRVIALPGQKLEIKPDTHEVIVDGKVLDETYIKEPLNSGGVFSYPITIPEGYYFVMGDNRNNSADSRDGDVGLISKDQIYGVAVARYAPIKEFKILLYK